MEPQPSDYLLPGIALEDDDRLERWGPMRLVTEGDTWFWWNWEQHGPPSFISEPFIKEMEEHARHHDTKKEVRERILREFIPWARWYRWYLADWEAWELDARVELARGSRQIEAGRNQAKGKSEEKRIRKRREGPDKGPAIKHWPPLGAEAAEDRRGGHFGAIRA